MTDESTVKAQNHKKLILDAYYEVFSTEKGKVVLHDLMKSCFVMNDPFEPGHPDQTAHNLGRQSVLKRILLTLNTDPEEYQKFMDAINKEGNRYETQEKPFI